MLSRVWGSRILGLFSVSVLMGADLRCVIEAPTGSSYSRRTVPNEEIGAQEAIADILGWQQLEFVGNNQLMGRDPADGNRKFVPAWAFDLQAAYALENRLVSLGLGKNYIRALQSLVSASSTAGPDSIETTFAVMRATPATRALAALHTLRDACRTAARQSAR